MKLIRKLPDWVFYAVIALLDGAFWLWIVLSFGVNGFLAVLIIAMLLLLWEVLHPIR